ncbi:MAG: agmatine/peptidylarginine deiminase [Terriglobales bacterium]
MPAEWEPHEATWLAWPHNKSDWPGKYEAIPFVFCEIIRHLVRGERVHLLVNDAAWEQKARRTLERAHVPLDNVEFHRWPTDRVWTRDSGPIFVRGGKGKLTVLDWRFNAWAKYPDWRNDDKIPARAARELKLPCIAPEMPLAEVAAGSGPLNRKRGTGNRKLVLEGGSIDVNGRGTMLTTEECLLSADVQVRNPGISQNELEQAFREYLGVTKTIWLERGIVGDDTHGHIDDIARFVAPDTVLAAVERDPADPNYETLRTNLELLRRSTDQDGRPLRVVELPMPAPVLFRGQRLPASYANFYIANAAVMVPTFDDPNDRHALDVLAGLFPDRPVVGIYCGDLVWGLGTIHCMTQQQPVAGS